MRYCLPDHYNAVDLCNEISNRVKSINSTASTYTSTASSRASSLEFGADLLSNALSGFIDCNQSVSEKNSESNGITYLEDDTKGGVIAETSASLAEDSRGSESDNESVISGKVFDSDVLYFLTKSHSDIVYIGERTLELLDNERSSNLPSFSLFLHGDLYVNVRLIDEGDLIAFVTGSRSSPQLLAVISVALISQVVIGPFFQSLVLELSNSSNGIKTVFLLLAYDRDKVLTLLDKLLCISVSIRVINHEAELLHLIDEYLFQNQDSSLTESVRLYGLCDYQAKSLDSNFSRGKVSPFILTETTIYICEEKWPVFVYNPTPENILELSSDTLLNKYSSNAHVSEILPVYLTLQAELIENLRMVKESLPEPTSEVIKLRFCFVKSSPRSNINRESFFTIEYLSYSFCAIIIFLELLRAMFVD